MRYVAVLRYGVEPGGHEYVFTRPMRREGSAAKERDQMVEMTRGNMIEHAGPGGRVVTGAHPTDPNAIVVACLHADGRDVYKTVTYRTVATFTGDG